MTLAASTYFEHLKAYVNSDYVTHDGTGGRVVLTEKYFRPLTEEEIEIQAEKGIVPKDLQQERRIELLLPGAGHGIQARPRRL